MLFGVVGRVDQRMCSVDGGVDRPTGRGNFGGMMPNGYNGVLQCVRN